jgi:hypothetical protein
MKSLFPLDDDDCHDLAHRKKTLYEYQAAMPLFINTFLMLWAERELSGGRRCIVVWWGSSSSQDE